MLSGYKQKDSQYKSLIQYILFVHAVQSELSEETPPSQYTRSEENVLDLIPEDRKIGATALQENRFMVQLI
jgi:hypothetical protein